MDWADDVAYSVHDVEDGVYAGSIRLARLGASERDQVCALAARLYLPPAVGAGSSPGLDTVLDRLLGLPALLDLRGFDVGPHVDTVLRGCCRHGLRQRVHAADREPDAGDAIHVSNDGVYGEGVVRRQAGVHRLEGEDALQSRVAEVTGDRRREPAKPTESR